MPNANFPAQSHDMLPDAVMRNAELRGDFLVTATMREFAANLAQARREVFFAGGGLSKAVGGLSVELRRCLVMDDCLWCFVRGHGQKGAAFADANKKRDAFTCIPA